MKLIPFVVVRPIQNPLGIWLVAREIDGSRLCDMLIDPFTANNILWAIDNTPFLRPLTHALIINIFKDLGFNLEKIIIIGIVNKTFRAVLFLRNKKRRIVKIDSRPSDAIVLALRKGCPMLINEELLRVDEEFAAQIKELEAVDTVPINPHPKMTEKEATAYLNRLDVKKLSKA